MSVIGSLGGDLLFEPEPERPEIITDLVRNRLKSYRKFLISSVRDLREDQPTTLLQVGTSRSLAVARIARYFPLKDFQVFIDTTLEIIARKSEVSKSFDSISKLKESFLIPDEIADVIFRDVWDNLPRSLPQSPSPEERSRYSLECSKILLNSFRKLEENQLAQLNPIPIGSGFLVGATHLLTNYHVLFDEEVARQCVAQFKYEEPLGVFQKQVDYELDPDALFIQEPNLDYALVQLKFNQLTRQAGHNFGWLQLTEDEGNTIPDISQEQQTLSQLEIEGYELSLEERQGDNVILIHHPKGRQKKIDLTNNRVASEGLYKKFLRYQGESDYGSSGCPVFNTKWELVALNHAAIRQEDGAFVKQGIKTCAIAEDLKRKASASSKLASFIEDFVITSEQLKYPPLLSALAFNGTNSSVSLGGTITFASVLDKTIVQLWGIGGVRLNSFSFYEETKRFLSQLLQESETKEQRENLSNLLRRLEVESKIFDLQFSPDGKTLAAMSRNGIIALWRLDQFLLINILDHGFSSYHPAIRFSPDTKVLATSSNNGIIKLWNPQDGALLRTLDFWDERDSGTLNTLYTIQFHPMNQILIGAVLNGIVKQWDEQGELISTSRLEGHEGLLGKLIISPDGKKIVSIKDGLTIENGLIQVWNVDGRLQRELDNESPVLDANISPDSDLLAVTTSEKFGFVSLRDDTNILISSPFTPKVYFAADGKTVIFVGKNSQEITFRQLTPNWQTRDDLLAVLKSLAVIFKLKNAGSLIATNPNGFHDLVAREQAVFDTLDLALTIEAWVNPTPNSTGGVITSNFLSSDRSSELGTYQLRVANPRNSVTGVVLFHLSRQDSNNLSLRNELSAPLAFGVFSHLAVTFDGDKTLKLYVNGQKLDEIQLELKPPVRFGQADIPEVIGASFYEEIDRSRVHAVIADRKLIDFFQGRIAEVRFWNKARTQKEIKATMYRRLHNNELLSPDLHSYWRLEEGEGNRIYNSASGQACASTTGLVAYPQWLTAHQTTSLPLSAGLQFGSSQQYRPFKGHWGGVTRVAVSPDGQRLVSSSRDQTVRIWDAQTGQAIGEPLRGHSSIVWAVAFSPDGQRIVSSSGDKTLQIWDAQTGQKIGQPLRGHDEPVWTVAFSPDGKRIISGSGLSNDISLRVWDARLGQAIGESLRGHGGQVTSVLFSPDGQYIASGSFDQTVRLWHAHTGQPIDPPLQHEDWVQSIAFSPNGRRLASGSGQKLWLWDIETAQPIGQPLQVHDAQVTSVAFSPDGQRIVTGSGDKTVKLWSIKTKQLIGQPLQHEASVSSVTFSPDGKRIVSGCDAIDSGTIHPWDVQTNEEIKLEPLQVQDGLILVSLNRTSTGESQDTAKLNENPFTTPYDASQIALNSLDTPHTITVEAWLKHQYGNCVIVSRLDNSGGYLLGWYNNKIRVELRSGDSVQKTVVDTKGQIPDDNVWHHVAFSWEKTTGEISIYFDGRLQETVVLEGEHKSITFEGRYRNIGLFSQDIEKLTADLQIGGSYETSKPTLRQSFAEEDRVNHFSILIAQVSLWNVVRTQTQIRATMSHRFKGGEEGLVGYWRLDEAVQDFGSQDRVGSHHGQLIGNVTPFPGKSNLPVSFRLKDIDGHWAEAFISILANQQILFDFIENDFLYPDYPITRAEFAKLVVRVFILTPLEDRAQIEPEFLDVKEDSSLYLIVKQVYRMGFLPTTSDTVFYTDNRLHPERTLKREEVISFLIEGLKFETNVKSLLENYSGELGLDLIESDLSRYSDRSEITPRYRAAIAVATQLELVVCLRPSELQPIKDITRAELAAMVYQAQDLLGNTAVRINSPYIVNPFADGSSN